MAGFGSGLAHALAQGAGGYEEGDLDKRRTLLALAQQKRAESRADIGTITSAAAAGLDITPHEDDVTNGSPTPTADMPRRKPIATVAGSDITIPEQGVSDKATRDAQRKAADRKARLKAYNDGLPDGDPNKLTEEGVGMVSMDDNLFNDHVKRVIGITAPPKIPIERRIRELTDKGLPLNVATKQARTEYGQLDPREVHRSNRDYDVSHPTSTGGPTGKERQLYILRRASALQKPGKNPLTGLPVPGKDRATAEREAAEEYDRVRVNNGGTETDDNADDTPEPATDPRTRPTSTPKKATHTTAGATGAGANSAVQQKQHSKLPPLSPRDTAMARKIPAFKQHLIQQGYKL